MWYKIQKITHPWSMCARKSSSQAIVHFILCFSNIDTSWLLHDNNDMLLVALSVFCAWCCECDTQRWKAHEIKICWPGTPMSFLQRIRRGYYVPTQKQKDLTKAKPYKSHFAMAIVLAFLSTKLSSVFDIILYSLFSLFNIFIFNIISGLHVMIKWAHYIVHMIPYVIQILRKAYRREIWKFWNLCLYTFHL